MIRPHRDITGLTDRLIELERQISDLRLQQTVVVNELDQAGVHALDGARSMQEWITSRADVTPTPPGRCCSPLGPSGHIAT